MDIFEIFEIFWEFLGNLGEFVGNFCWDYFGNLEGNFGNSLGILWEFLVEFFGNCQWLFPFWKVKWFLTFSKSADCLHWFLNCKSQLITKKILNMGRIDLFVKTLVFVKILGFNGERRKREGEFQSLEVQAQAHRTLKKLIICVISNWKYRCTVYIVLLYFFCII